MKPAIVRLSLKSWMAMGISGPIRLVMKEIANQIRRM